jgi:hypothetical protein
MTDRKEYMRKYHQTHKVDRSDYMKEYFKNNKEKISLKHDEWLKNNKDKRLAWRRKKYLGRGDGFYKGLNKRDYSGKCEICGWIPNGKKILAYHHWDDTNPSKGLWVCYVCHCFVERMDKGFLPKYSTLRMEVENAYTKETASDINEQKLSVSQIKDSLQ